MMRIIFLGTNGWYDTQTGNTLCVYIETKGEYIIFDAGGGFYKIDKYITTPKPIFLFLSHFHLDHLIGLHTLNKFSFTQGISIYGPKGIKEILGRLLDRPFTKPLHELKTAIALHELRETKDLPFPFLFRKLIHPSACYGFRCVLENKVIAFLTDTGICNNGLRIAKDADLLISECSYAPGYRSRNWPHLTPQSAAFLARKAKAKRLALVHFDALMYTTKKQRLYAEKCAKRIFKHTFAACDNQRISL